MTGPRNNLNPSVSERRKYFEEMTSGQGQAVGASRRPIQMANHDKVAMAIKEMFAVNKKFHEQTKELVSHMEGLLAGMSEDDKNQFGIFLQPYKQLVSNPFNAEPSGDIDQDIAHIVSVISASNLQFTKALKAMNEAVANMSDLHLQLEKLKKNKIFLQRIETIAGSSLKLDGQLGESVKHLVRYELLLSAIKREIIAAGCPVDDASFVMLLSSIEHVSPEIKRMNQYMDVVMLFNQCERTLYRLLGLEAEKVTNGGDAARHGLLLAVNELINNAKETIAAGEGDQAIYRWIKAIHLSMKELLGQYGDDSKQSYLTYAAGFTKQYVEYAGSFFPANVTQYVLGEKENVPSEVSFIQELSAVVVKLEQAERAYSRYDLCKM